MPKVKIFEDHNSFYLEKDINNFIQDKKVLNISYNVYMCGYSTYYSACVLYEDYEGREQNG